MSTSPLSIDQKQEDPNIQNPNSMDNEEQPQSPQTLTLQPEKHPDQERETVQETPQQQQQGNKTSPLSLQPITDTDVITSTTTKPTSTKTKSTAFRRGGKKRKRVIRPQKLEALRKKYQTLLQNLKPIPFIPEKALDFLPHEKLLKRIGLWDFVNLELECNNIRTDLIAQLIVGYDRKLRTSEVNGVKIKISRADLARALKLPLPVKKENVSNVDVGSEENDDVDGGSEESVRFIKDLVSYWVLLHEETWLVPEEVYNWTRMIEKGNAEKVEWASLVWLMVEKELSQGEKLIDCYYASHLQCLMKSQCERIFIEKVENEVVSVKEDEDDVEGGEDSGVVKMESEDGADADISEHDHGGGDSKNSEYFDVDFKRCKVESDGADLKKSEVESDVKMSEVDGDLKMNVVVGDEETNEVEDHMKMCEDAGLVKENETDAVQKEEVEEPSVELTLGQDIVDKGQERDGNAMKFEECRLEEPTSMFGGNISMGEHFLHPCSLDIIDRRLDIGKEGKQEEDSEEQEEEEEAEEEELQEGGFNLSPKCNTFQGISLGNHMQSLDMAQGPYSSPMQLHHQSLVDHHLTSRGETSTAIFRNTAKREIDHEDDMSHQQLNDNNKRLRSNDSWVKKESEFETCMENIHHWMSKARMMYEAKENACEELNMNQQVLFNELQQRNNVIEHLQKAKYDVHQKSQVEIYRLERELFTMSNILDFYRKALKENDRAFSEYRAHYQVPEEPLYKDVPGSGGLMLSTMELEKQQLKQEEEDRIKKEEEDMLLRLKQEEEERIEKEEEDLLRLKQEEEERIKKEEEEDRLRINKEEEDRKKRMQIENTVKKFETEFVGKLKSHLIEVDTLNCKITDMEKGVKVLKDAVAVPKMSEMARSPPKSPSAE